MKKTGFISVEHNPGDPPIETDTNWAAVDALTDEQIEAAVRDDPDAAPIGFFELPGFTPIPNAKRLREKLGLTQEEFAKTYRIPVGTLREAISLSVKHVKHDVCGVLLRRRFGVAALIGALAFGAMGQAARGSLANGGLAEANAALQAGQADAARDSLRRSLKSGKNFSGMDEAKTALSKLEVAGPTPISPKT